MNKILEITETI